MSTIREIGRKSKKASVTLSVLSTEKKNEALLKMSEELKNQTRKIIDANYKDIKNAKDSGIKPALIERLMLNEERINGMVNGLLALCDLPDPVGKGTVIKRPNELTILKQRVPVGVIGIIYESRPNVTSDAAGLCLKAGNSVILRGGSEAINSNKAIISALVSGLKKANLPTDSIQLIEDTGYDKVQELCRMDEYVDVLVPRGGEGLIKAVMENSTVPVIETGAGNCHVYIDRVADFKMAKDIVINAKTDRPSVCNAAETLLVHDKIAEEFLPETLETLSNMGVEIRGCQKTKKIFPNTILASEEDWDDEYLDMILCVKVVKSYDEAIEHINRHGTSHSEAIVTKDYETAKEFLARVDAACVYANASTRFTDGGEFGMGAEIGISTQKLHARGPMGLEELTTVKYLVLGNGQIR
ncbi:MAG TPA: glutamate-5-semialdehyde dehydrogenase [Thermoanaerobacterales bacterium]|nr:glutamate-5-semialdehyde dehydrogenase [Thermoanaerobacterales bacterium]